MMDPPPHPFLALQVVNGRCEQVEERARVAQVCAYEPHPHTRSNAMAPLCKRMV